MSNRFAAYLGTLIRQHLRLGFLVREQPLTRRALARYRRDVDPWVFESVVVSLCDRLATRGLVVREPVPDDRRGTWVALTDEGRSRVDGAFIDLLAEERDLLAVLPPAEQSDLAASLRQLLLEFESPTG